MNQITVVISCLVIIVFLPIFMVTVPSLLKPKLVGCQPNKDLGQRQVLHSDDPAIKKGSRGDDRKPGHEQCLVPLSYSGLLQYEKTSDEAV